MAHQPGFARRIDDSSGEFERASAAPIARPGKPRRIAAIHTPPTRLKSELEPAGDPFQRAEDCENPGLFRSLSVFFSSVAGEPAYPFLFWPR